MQPKRLSLTEQLAHSTVRIEVTLTNGDIGTGTGFFFRFLENGSHYVPVVVTNKHVIRDAVLGRFHLTVAENGLPGTRHEQVQLDQFENRWVPHPDPDIDLVAMPIAPIMVNAQNNGFSFFFIALNKAVVASATDLEQFAPGEEIMMIGYPNGI
jgi:hypothetical protein